MTVRHISGHLKGRNFSETLDKVTCFVGPNGAGKSTRLLAVELALRGPRSKDKRYGPGPASVTADCAAGVIRRELAPKHQVSIGGKGGKLADVQAEIDKAVPLSPHVFDIAAFVSMSEEKKRQALLDLAAPIAADTYANLYPEVTPAPGEGAGDWLGRAMEAAKQERLALMAQVRESTKTTTALDNSTRGQFESLEAAKEDLAAAKQVLAQVQQYAAVQQARQAAGEQLATVRESLASIEVQTAAALPMDLAPLERGLREAMERDRRLQAAASAKAAADDELQRCNEALANCGRTNARALAGLTLVHALLLEGFTAEASVAVEALSRRLQVEGFVAMEPAALRRHTALRKVQQAETDLERLQTEAASQKSTALWQSDLGTARGHNAGVEAARAKAAEAQRRREQLQRTEQALLADLERPMPDAPAVDLDTARARVAEMDAAVVEMAQRQGVRQAEIRLAEQANAAQVRIAKLKTIEAELSDARDEVLRRALSPVSRAMGTFVRLLGGTFEVGEDSVLGMRRDGTWLPVECLSDSEQALFGAGLALALAGAGGSRLVLVDRLDVCDADRAAAFLAEAVAAVERGDVDQVLATAHTVSRGVSGVSYRSVEPEKI